MPVSIQNNPILYRLSVKRHQFRRWVSWIWNWRNIARKQSFFLLPYRIKAHKSVLMRKLGDADMQLQMNKVTNLRLAADKVDGVIIKPGQTFSLWRSVGKATRLKGYKVGLLLSSGEMLTGVGGGLCQMGNLLYWMALHTPLTIAERHGHGYDIFPDSGRVIPFGTGASLFYNYVDLQFRNDTEHTFQIRVEVDETHLKGEIRCENELAHSYKIKEKAHRFIREEDGNIWRENEIWRRKIDRRTGDDVAEEFIYGNRRQVLYEPGPDVVIEEKNS